MTFPQALIIGICLAVLISIALDYTHDVRPVRVHVVKRALDPVRPETIYRGTTFPYARSK